MNTKEILKQFQDIASNPKATMDKYLASGKKVILVAPVYTPEEIIYSMDCIPMGAWGADIQINEAKRYFPAFICSIMQSILELGMNGTYNGASAIVIPSLCDSLKTLGENWKYGVKNIPFIPMTYPQNRKPDFGHAYTKAGYERVIKDLEKATGNTFDDAKLADAIKVYNEHNAVMREFAKVVGTHGEITTAERSAVFKAGTFMDKAEHTKMVKDLLASLANDEAKTPKIKVVTSGILADAPGLTKIFDDLGMTIVADDVAAETRQYRTDAPAAQTGETNLDTLVNKFCEMDNCSVLYDVEKKRIDLITAEAEANKADGVVIVLTKFCDPEEFDYPLIKKACEAKSIPCMLIEVDRQMDNLEQARTMLQTFTEML